MTMTSKPPSSPARTPVRRPPLAVLVAISALQPFALNVLAPATPGLARALATDYATIQLTLTIYLVAVAVTQLFVGPVSDRIGRRPCILAGAVLFVAGSLLGVLADGVATLLLARAIQAMGGGTMFALARAVVRDTATSNESASLIGYITMGMVVAPMVAPLVGGLLDSSFGWRSIFAATAAFGLVGGLAAAALLSETAPARDGAAAPSAARAVADLARERAFLGYTLALAFCTASFFALIAGAPYVVVEIMGRGPDTYGLYFMLNAGGYMVGNFITGRFGRRLGGARLVATGTAISLVSVGVTMGFALSGSWTPAMLFLPLVVNSFGNGMTIPGATAAALSVRPDLAGTAAGLTGAAQLGLGAISAAIVGSAVTVWGPWLVAIMLLCSAAAWAAYWFGRAKADQG